MQESHVRHIKFKKPIGHTIKTMFLLLRPERQFYWSALVFGVAISLLTLATPISVQTLINTVANIGLPNQVVVLSVILFSLLMLAGILYACQKYIMELFERRFFARVVSDLVMRIIHADVISFRGVNRAELVNRYFDIMTIQKNVPYILTGGVALILQSVVGIVVVSFYHPALLTFNIIFVISVYLVWRFWGYRAIGTALSLSNAKYNAAKWFEEMASLNTEFKSRHPITYALEYSDRLAQQYIRQKSRHFSLTFKQLLGFLFIYAIFSAALLGVGGLLVIRGELSLGQLVAAELILISIFYGVARADTYLDMIYELVPAAEKISYFYKISQEKDAGNIFQPKEVFDICFKKIRCSYRDEEIRYDMALKAGQKVMVSSASYVLQEYFIDLIKAYRYADKGSLLLDDQDIRDLDVRSLRDKIAVLDTPMVLETTIEQYLQIASPDTTQVEMMDALSLVHLDHIIERLPEGMQTQLISNGYPLSASETIRLKLAALLLSKPQIMIITEHFDVVAYHIRQAILEAFAERKEMSVMYFTNRRDLSLFDQYLFFGWEGQDLYDSVEALDDAAKTNK